MFIYASSRTRWWIRASVFVLHLSGDPFTHCQTLSSRITFSFKHLVPKVPRCPLQTLPCTWKLCFRLQRLPVCLSYSVVIGVEAQAHSSGSFHVISHTQFSTFPHTRSPWYWCSDRTSNRNIGEHGGASVLVTVLFFPSLVLFFSPLDVFSRFHCCAPLLCHRIPVLYFNDVYLSCSRHWINDCHIGFPPKRNK